jgi:hypothetical protein
MLKDTFRGLQFGCCYEGGAEHIVHTARAFVRAATGDEVVVTVDCRNAFNSPSRQAMWTAARCIPQLRNLFGLEYSTASALFPCGTTAMLRSRSGSRQGSASGPVFFSLAIHDALRATSEQVEGVKVMAYLDDVTILAASPALAQRATRTLLSHLHAIGLRENADKCDWFAPSGAPFCPDGPCAGFTHQRDGIKLLGAQVARDDATEARRLLAKDALKHAVFFRRLARMTGTQAMALLMKCGVPKMSYTLRVHSADVTRELCERFDAQVEEIWSRLASVAPNFVSRTVACLPLRTGGLGITRTELIANAAYTASRNVALHLEGPKSQDDITAGLFTTLRASLVAQHPHIERHLEMHALPGAADWIADASVAVNPDHHAAAMRLRLASPVVGSPDAMRCPGCNATFNAYQWQQHTSCTAHTRGPNASSRHADVADAFRGICRAAGVRCEDTEPRDMQTFTCAGCDAQFRGAAFFDHRRTCVSLPEAQRRRRVVGSGPDIDFDDHTSDEVVEAVADVQIRGPLCPSYAGRTSASLLEETSATKHARYDEMCAAAGKTLVVFGALSVGHLSREFASAIERVAAVADLDRKASLRRISLAVVLCTGRSLLNAERALGLAPPSLKRVARTVDPVSAVTGFSWNRPDAAPATPPVAPIAAPAEPASHTPAPSRALAPVLQDRSITIAARMSSGLPAEMRAQLHDISLATRVEELVAEELSVRHSVAGTFAAIQTRFVQAERETAAAMRATLRSRVHHGTSAAPRAAAAPALLAPRQRNVAHAAAAEPEPELPAAGVSPWNPRVFESFDAPAFVSTFSERFEARCHDDRSHRIMMFAVWWCHTLPASSAVSSAALATAALDWQPHVSFAVSSSSTMRHCLRALRVLDASSRTTRTTLSARVSDYVRVNAHTLRPTRPVSSSATNLSAPQPASSARAVPDASIHDPRSNSATSSSVSQPVGFARGGAVSSPPLALGQRPRR